MTSMSNLALMNGSKMLRFLNTEGNSPMAWPNFGLWRMLMMIVWEIRETH